MSYEQEQVLIIHYLSHGLKFVDTKQINIFPPWQELPVDSLYLMYGISAKAICSLASLVWANSLNMWRTRVYLYKDEEKNWLKIMWITDPWLERVWSEANQIISYLIFKILLRLHYPLRNPQNYFPTKE
jgi:hypothetical protein